jgi:bis(5'-nucleosyl)-tetraphosphatase (symmetrical)
MAIYVIGDIQGCYQELRQLLDKIQFDPAKDKLWSVGDLVNRGPDSLQVLRFFKALGKRGQIVLGNHDLTLLARAYGNLTYQHPHDSLEPILTAPDRNELLDWLRHQPFLFHSPKQQVTLIHAGLPPQWTLAQAQSCSQELESILQSEQHVTYLSQHIFGETPSHWSKELTGWPRIRFIAACFTRLRYCDALGHLLLKQKMGTHQTDQRGFPWFAHPKRKTAKDTIVFGHWATLGYHDQNNVYALDTGCLWGGKLTALRLKNKTLIQIPCPKAHDPAQFNG